MKILKRQLVEILIAEASDEKPDGAGWTLELYQVDNGVKTHTWTRTLKVEEYGSTTFEVSGT